MSDRPVLSPTHVVIPLALFQQMARAYYGQAPTQGVQVREPVVSKQTDSERGAYTTGKTLLWTEVKDG